MLKRAPPTQGTAPAQALADGFAMQVEAWAQALGATAANCSAASRAAAAVSLATSAGHACLLLNTLPALDPLTPTAGWRQALLASAVVGTPREPGARPLVLDEEGRLYLHRYFDHERRLAQRLLQAARAAPTAVSPAAQALLLSLFAAPGHGPEDAPGPNLNLNPDWQQLATALALRRRLAVISGGPGTGKTSTVVKLLACLLAQDPACRIALAAPTGKAAARLGEALRQQAASLPAGLRDLLPSETYTLHRLLGATATPGVFQHHAGRLLAIDTLVVDEASMLDLALARALLDAVPATARIVLLGDKDQLAAVESGAVFSELSADPVLSPACRLDLAQLCQAAPDSINPPAAGPPSALRDSAVWFSRNHRFAAGSGIGRLAADIQQQRVEAVLDWLRTGADASVRWLAPAGAGSAPFQAGPASAAGHEAAALAAQALDHATQAYGRFFEALEAGPLDPGQAHALFGRFRVLCAVRQGVLGMNAVNAHIGQQARSRLAARLPPGAAPLSSPWYAGRPVMVLRNDPMLGLFNGDIGICLPQPGSERDGAAGGPPPLAVWFAAGEGWRALLPARLPEHQTAYAMTVHKAQGSEFDEVLVLLPSARSRVLTRELLYTAVTRARSRVALAASAQALAWAINTPTRRQSGLLARLRDAALQADAEVGPGPGT